MMSTGACLVYVTAASAEEARMIGDAVVEERLAACANILGAVESAFVWNGAIERGAETALLLKTAGDRLDALVGRVASLHSYDEPCVVALPIMGGSAAFIDWIVSETRAEGP